MEVVIDSHSLFWYLSKESRLEKRLSSLAREVLDKSKNIYVPTIVLLEIFYIFKKEKQPSKFAILLKRVETHPKMKTIDLDLEIVKVSTTTDIPEMHDRIIVATSKVLKAYLITKDQTISKYYKKTIW